MIFPYFKGMVFCARINQQRGLGRHRRCLSQPSASRPSRYSTPKSIALEVDLPVSIDLGVLKPGDGWKEVGRNVLGEMQLLVLLRKHGGKSAAAGWDGDRYAVFEGPKDRLGLVWLSTWDSEDDAREFAKGYVQYQTSKLSNIGKPPRPIPDKVWRNLDEVLYVVERRGLDVAVVEGFTPASTPGLVEAAFLAKKSELKPVENKKAALKPGSQVKSALAGGNEPPTI